MSRIVITGASGNTGTKTLYHLINGNKGLQDIQILASVSQAGELVAPEFEGKVAPINFRFGQEKNIFQEQDRVFLLRPPALTDLKKYFIPFVRQAVESKVEHIVFISVQGVEKSSFIPHFGIEKLIRESGISYTFLRNAYFMQNLTTTLYGDIMNMKEIYIPAGPANFNWVDVDDIGAVAAKILLNPSAHKNKAYELTGTGNYNFYFIANLLTIALNKKITYTSPSLFTFYLHKKKQGLKPSYIIILMILHYLPRFMAEPAITDCIEEIIGRKPRTIETFIAENFRAIK